MKNDSKKVIEIAQSVKNQRNHENVNKASNPAIAYIRSSFSIKDNNFEENIFWLTNRENYPSVVQKDFTGTPTIINLAKSTFILKGKAVYKNTKLGGILIGEMNNAIKSYKAPYGEISIKIEDRCVYNPSAHSEEAQNLIIESITMSKKVYFEKLKELFKKFNEIEDDIKALEEEKKKEEDFSQEMIELQNQILEGNRKRKELLDQAQKFIRKNAELRHQPILDPFQEEIKRSHIYDGKIVTINGGPGTGKTTSLIQRIKFLTSHEAMVDYGSLRNQQLEKLANSQKSWIFFSPSELLKLFLKNAISEEGLTTSDKNIQVWDSYRSVLVKKYLFYNSETQSPFLKLNNKYQNDDLIPNEPSKVAELLQEFEQYFFEELKKEIDNTLDLADTNFTWSKNGLLIQQYIKSNSKTLKKGVQFIALYFNLKEKYASIIKEIRSNLSKQLDKSSVQLLYKLKNDKLAHSKVSELVNKWLDERDLDEDDEDFALYSEDYDYRSQDTNQEILKYLKGIIRKRSLKKYGIESKLTQKENEILDAIGSDKFIDTLQNLDDLGQDVLFIKYFGKIVQGVETNLFNAIPRIYKSFRKKSVQKNSNSPFNLELLEIVVNEEKPLNKRLHAQEESLLLYFTNKLIKEFYDYSFSKSEELEHTYISSFREYSRIVIGVDEATDFHPIDLLCIASFGDIDFSSITFSGDLMQRMTHNGIRDWFQLKYLIPNLLVKDLKVSYRQSPTLLEVAKTIYNKATGLSSKYKSYTQIDEKEPDPLFFQYQDESESIDWIADRIEEIYKAYGRTIPSIAIFLNNTSDVSRFAKQLGEVDKLADCDIRVKGCDNGEVLGDANTVRVFSLEYIKGLEFEAVFYHNLSKISETSEDLFLKYLYVGLSRASFYLGVTSTNKLDEFPFLKDLFNQRMDNWKILR